MLHRLAALLLAVATASCATVSHGRNETISIDSSPAGASVELKCDQITRSATTPAAIIIPRNATECVATVSKPGFAPKTVAFDRSPSRAYWLNFIGIAALPFGISDNSPIDIGGGTGLALIASGVAGLSVDAFNGAMFKHSPSTVKVTLDPTP